MLQWAEWLRNCVLGGRETVFVNLDETPMAKQMPARCGYVCNLIGTLDSDWHARITTRDTRSHATLMAAVCDDTLLQKHLPQLLLTKDRWCDCIVVLLHMLLEQNCSATANSLFATCGAIAWG